MDALFLWIWLRKVFKGGKRRGGKGRGGERERRVGETKGEREREGRGEGEGEGESEGGKTLIMIQEVVVWVELSRQMQEVFDCYDMVHYTVCKHKHKHKEQEAKKNKNE